ncbi:hypothetical protein QW060_08185 [Myroides ceti]|uniref:Uncharacterized protein n=2 Tax=Paenimyroides ceti TaxID=395087 RepID=A0ABT8CU79_9FLAO|nr:hypothetical protein [Paenimyroides ceti]MDN3707112.1 hypothetical protein [Paenimyroides ceti]
MLFGLGTFAQEAEKDNVAIFQDFVDESVAFFASDEFISMNECYDTFYDMINLTVTKPPLGGGEQMDLGDWLTENLGVTKFSSAEEGVMMLYRCGQQADAVSYKMRILFSKLDSIVSDLSKEEMYEVFFPVLSRYIVNEAYNKSQERKEFSESIIRNSDTTAQIKHSNP